MYCTMAMKLTSVYRDEALQNFSVCAKVNYNCVISLFFRSELQMKSVRICVLRHVGSRSEMGVLYLSSREKQ